MKRFFLQMILVYRSVKFLFPVTCKYYPSCSEYACQALDKYPTRTALRLIIVRLFRCHPFSRGGPDILL